MKDTDIYQTLEDRQNYDDVEKHGPYFCCARDANGTPKSGVKSRGLAKDIISGTQELLMRNGGVIPFTSKRERDISFAIQRMTSTHLCCMIWWEMSNSLKSS